MTGIPSQPGAPMLFNKSLAIPIPDTVKAFSTPFCGMPIPLSEAWRTTTHPTRPGSNITPFERLRDAVLAARIALSSMLPRFWVQVGSRVRNPLGPGSCLPLPCLGVPRWQGCGCVLVSYPRPRSWRSFMNTRGIKWSDRDVLLSLLLPHLAGYCPSPFFF